MTRLDELRSRFQEEPLGKLLGAKLDELEDGSAVVSAPASEGTTIVGGIVQGGITTVLADYAGVYSAMTRIPAGHTPAAQISIHFFRPIRLGETICAKARVENESRSSLFVSVDVYASDHPGEWGRRRACATILFSKPRA
jgi:uncharacterized protein (TIGR00369 family)